MSAGQYSLSDIAPNSAPPPVKQAGRYSFDDIAAPEQEPGMLAKAGNFVTDTLSKTAHNMNLENILGHVAEADRLAGQGRIIPNPDRPDESTAGSELKAIIPNPLDIAKDVWGKIHSGDISGAAAGLLPLLLMGGGPEAAEGASGLVSDAAAATRKTISESPTIAGSKAAAPELVKNLPVVGRPITAATKAYQAAYQAAKAGLDEATAARITAAKQAASDAAIAEQRANGRRSLADIAGIQVGQRAPIPPIEPIRPPFQSVRNTPAEAGGAVPPAAAPAGPSPEVLDGIAQWATKKPFNKLSAKDQASVRALASKVGNPLGTLGAIADETVAPVVPEIKVKPPAPGETSVLSYPGHTKGFDMSEWTDAEKAQFSPQEVQARQSIVMRLAPALLKAGLKAEDLETDAGRARAAEVASAIPGLSKNKALMNSLKQYDPSDLTIDAAQTLMKQWGKFAPMLGFKTLGDVTRK